MHSSPNIYEGACFLMYKLCSQKNVIRGTVQDCTLCLIYLKQLELYERQSIETDRNHALVYDPVLQHPWSTVQDSTAFRNLTRV
jgi:hypothetical protein